MKSASLLLIFLFLSVFIAWGQNPKQKSVDYYSWNYPLVKSISRNIGFSVDEEPLPVRAAIFYRNGEEVDFLEGRNVKTTISSSFVNDLDLWSYKTVPFDKADVRVYFVPQPTVFKVIGYKEKRGVNGDEDRYTGQLKMLRSLKIEVKDTQNNMLYETVLEDVNELHSISAFENQSIKTEQKAIDLMKAHFLENPEKYFARAGGSLSGPLYYKMIVHLQDVLDVRRKKSTLYLYSYNKKKGYDFSELQNSIDQLVNLADIDPGPHYQSLLEDRLLPKIDFWRTQVTKYNKKDKKERKIVWGLLANISGAYYALGENEKALEVYKEIEQLNYRASYTYLKDMPLEQISKKENFFGEGKDQTTGAPPNFKGSHNPSYVFYQNTGARLLGVNEAMRSKADLQKNEEKALVLYKLLSHYEYLAELKRLSKKFNDKGDVNVGFEETDAYFVEVFNREIKESEEIKYLDLSVLEDKEKILVTKISQELIDFYEVYDKEISLNKTISSDSEELKRLFDKRMVILSKLFLDEKYEKRELDNSIVQLTDLMLTVNNETIRQLPLLELLLDELSSENKLRYTDNPRLFKQLFKRYQKTYVLLFVGETTIKKYLHHSAINGIKEELNDYYRFYRADFDEVESKYKNLHNEARVVKILSTFIK
ncbi:hypothetical protein [Maribacter thermophilus]|uniref:hypothetical protein n=1 Tax=Maribacter thermophilus TaxID=1197874 RepID=UPI0006416FA0|nr:hypothetical protein [Maribacter thermophilus]